LAIFFSKNSTQDHLSGKPDKYREPFLEIRGEEPPILFHSEMASVRPDIFYDQKITWNDNELWLFKQQSSKDEFTLSNL